MTGKILGGYAVWCAKTPNGGALTRKETQVSEDQKKEHMERKDERPEDVEAHKFHEPEVNEEPDVEGHVFEKAEKAEKAE
jgi:hypothetical protein